MNFRLQAKELVFKRPFHLSTGTRLGTKAVFLEIYSNELTGYSEACFPPYIQEKSEKAIELINSVLSKEFNLEFDSLQKIDQFIDVFDLPPFTRCLLFNAITDLNARRFKQSLREFAGIDSSKKVYQSTLTVTKSDLDFLHEKSTIAQNFSMLKLKCDGHNDLDFVNNVMDQIPKPFCVDVNQGWDNLPKDEVISLVKSLKQKGCTLIEQPFNKNNHIAHLNLKKMSILPIIADEGIQNLDELIAFSTNYDGVNIKLLKCGGFDQAMRMLNYCEQEKLISIVGCMSESSCGCATAFQLNGLADYFDIDGPWLINNDPFNGFSIKNGLFETKFSLGNGVLPKN